MKKITLRSIHENGSKKAINHGLDRLAGLWSSDDADEFDNNLKAQRKVDDEQWGKAK